MGGSGIIPEWFCGTIINGCANQIPRKNQRGDYWKINFFPILRPKAFLNLQQSTLIWLVYPFIIGSAFLFYFDYNFDQIKIHK